MKYNKGFAPILIALIVAGALIIGGGVYYWGKNKGENKKVKDSQIQVNDLPTNWNQYSNKYYPDYTINYPKNLNLIENGQDNRRAIISSKDYDLDMATGRINSGFKVDIFVNYFESLDKLFLCNKNLDDFAANCLLSRSEAQLLNYQKGEVKSEPIIIDDYSGVKYEFISSEGDNNNIGIVIKKDDKYFVALIAYRNNKDLELYNKILSSFRLTKLENPKNKVKLDDMDSWEKYTDENYNFELKYPPSVSMDSVGLRGLVGVVDNGETRTLDDSANLDVSLLGGPSIATVKKVMIDGRDARVVCSKADGCVINILLPKPVALPPGGDRYFKFLIVGSRLPIKYIDQIVSSFKFLK
jgi:hypothetical protein